MGAQKLGQPEPESNFVEDANSCAPQQTQVYVPSACCSTYSPLKGRSVPCLRVT